MEKPLLQANIILLIAINFDVYHQRGSLFSIYIVHSKNRWHNFFVPIASFFSLYTPVNSLQNGLSHPEKEKTVENELYPRKCTRDGSLCWMRRAIASDRPISLPREALKLLKICQTEEHREPSQLFFSCFVFCQIII